MAINKTFPKNLHKIKGVQSFSSHLTSACALFIIHFMTNI
jgi:hypothetical protein